MKCPEKVIKDIQKIFFNFIWNGKDRIKRNTLINTYDKGGIRMPDIQSYIEAMHAAWVTRLLNSENETWALLMRHIVQEAVGCSLEDVISTNVWDICSCPIMYELPEFMQSIIICFNKSKRVEHYPKNKNVQIIASEFVWGNVFMKDRGKCLCISTGYNM